MSSFHEAAPALLGSALLRNEEKHESLQPTPASCGSCDVDVGALEGGFRYGEVTAIAGANGTGKTTLAFQAIASHLVVHEHGEVALIATTDPPLAHLRDILIVRLQRSRRGPAFTESGYVYKKHVTTTPPTRDTMDRISKMLEHVQISRVFDFAGVVEAVSEFSANVDENARTNDEKLDENDHKGPRSIADSEDEAMDDLSAEQELNALTEDKPNTSKKPAANMLVIDNIANVLGSMMTKSQVQGHALLANFMRSLHQLTRRRHICTLILNAAVGLRSQNAPYHRRPEDQVSVFASITGKPGLGKHFSYLVDTSIFLSTLPRSKDDADVAYGDARESRKYNEVGVIEVLKDRYGGREGRWSAFVVEDGIELRGVPL
ncbi:MAG: hypothetical protein LQ345_003488 [Seirophora villosa]|nr:MAG: hypothetical protein LQ345_003488 [Seirophora villosa]